MTIYLSLLVALVGLVIYIAVTHAKAAEVGRIMFWTGLLAFLLQFARSIVTR